MAAKAPATTMTTVTRRWARRTSGGQSAFEARTIARCLVDANTSPAKGRTKIVMACSIPMTSRSAPIRTASSWSTAAVPPDRLQAGSGSRGIETRTTPVNTR